MGPTRQAIKDSGLSSAQIDKVILVGGSTRIPAVQNEIKKILGKDPDRSVNPDEGSGCWCCYFRAGFSAERLKTFCYLTLLL